MPLNFTILLLLKYLEVDLICLFVFCFFFAPRTDIILKTRSTLWLTVIFSANSF